MKPDAYQFRCKWDDGTVSEWFEINERQMLNIRDNPKYEIRGLYTAATWRAGEREASAFVAYEPVPYPKREDVTPEMRASFERLFSEASKHNHSTLMRNEQGAYRDLWVAADWVFYQRAWADALASAPVAREAKPVADEAIKAEYVRHFGNDAGWLDYMGSYFTEGYRIGRLAAPQASDGSAAPSDEQCEKIYLALDELGRSVDQYELGLPRIDVEREPDEEVRQTRAAAFKIIRDALRSS